ncbi:carboxymuconolactone decarboxylase family protein [Nonomuraea sp. PA05]|uniref:carboxymuconolactone decarboxylase family protein n=1 Tax=Nonomuraea sp. PA05 TaxID=2604466 RepID=UPI0011D4FA4F|nr:carboxymuconolactone decarboxylase family protein [Nonomuraea sp. PA05]TYB71467.1 carboxymuconolactone decarboxylase family protein [Nonomuraea sp. PA05]
MLALATARGVLAQVRHVSPVPPRAAHGLVARVYAQLVRDFGMAAPPVLLHSPAPEVLAACWVMLRESLLCGGAAERVVKEVVASEVSAANACPYCVDVHRATLRGLPGHDDPRLASVAAWARAMGGGGAAAGLSCVPDTSLVAVAVTFHYLNRMVAVFLGDSPLPPELPRRARGPALRLFGRIMSPAARRTPPPGLSLPLLPAAPVPPDLAWAGTGRLADAFARASAAIETAGQRSVPAPVRTLVTERLAAWDGGPPAMPSGSGPPAMPSGSDPAASVNGPPLLKLVGPPSRAWATEAAAGLPPSLRPAATLALLTALAPYQVDDGTIAAYRSTRSGGHDDRTLIELTAWASLSAARRVADRLPTLTPVNASSVERTDP